MKRAISHLSSLSESSQRVVASALLAAYAFSAPVSNFFGQVCFFLFVGVSLLRLKSALRIPALEWLRNLSIAWVFVLIVSTGVSLEPMRSIPEAFKSLLYFFVPFAVCDLLLRFEAPRDRFREIVRLLIFLGLGQSLAALHSIVSTAAGIEYRMGLTGPVTESGQLALVLPAILGLVVSLRERKGENRRRALASLLGLLLVLAGWGNKLHPTYGVILQLLSGGGALFLILQLKGGFRITGLQRMSFTDERNLSLIIVPLLSAAFLLNLKRGPWLGVFIAMIIVGTLLRPKLALKTVMISALAVAGLAPVRERLFSLVQDFTISGGRKRMWELGIELLERFPLGVGFRNAKVMRTLDPYLPETHRHLHSNFLNIAVEHGYVGLVVYLTWIGAIILFAFRFAESARRMDGSLESRSAFLGVCLGGSLLAWQLAGTVEYNFGDAEIRMIAVLLIGLLVTLPHLAQPSPAASVGEDLLDRSGMDRKDSHDFDLE